MTSLITNMQLHAASLLLCALPSLTCAAPSLLFSRQEILIMHNYGIKMALEGENEPYIIPADIQHDQLVKTETLSFANLNLHVVPPWLARFTQLRHLDFSGTFIKANQLRVLSKMQVLENLNLANVPLFEHNESAIADVWASLKNLRILNLSNTAGQIRNGWFIIYNDTADLYAGIEQLRNLVHLDVSKNRISNLTPLGLANLTALRILNLSENKLGVLDMRQLPVYINELDLSNCKIKNFSWHEGLDFPNLGLLKLGGNSGLEIAPEWGDIFLMQQLAALEVDSDVTVPKVWQDRLDKIRAQQEAARKAACLAHGGGRFITHSYCDNGDGTVTDTTTNLMWKRCSEGQTWTGSTCAGEAITMTWDEAMPNAQQKSWTSFAGCSDWRMPSIEELRSLVYCSSGKPKTWNDTVGSCEGEYESPTIDQIVFPNTPSGLFTGWFWSASPHAYYAANAWVVHFYNGNYYDYYRAFANRARLVCAGQ